MAKWDASRGSSGRIAWVFLPDSSSTVGAGKVALTNASALLTIAVRREKAAAVTAYTGGNIGSIVTLGTWVDPGAGKVNFKEVDAANLPGIYELHFVDLLFAAGDVSRWIGGMVTATGIAPSPFEVGLDAIDAQNATSLGLADLDAAISTRSTYAGGAVASVTAPVTVGTNNDKTGYGLSAAAITAIWNEVLEGAYTARQYMRGYASALLGLCSGMATGTGIFRDTGNTKPRITVTQDANGNRSVITLDLT